MNRILTTLMTLATSIVCVAGNIKTDSIMSNVLNAKVMYNVYLPDGFNKTNETYPVVYLLHGFTDNYRAWADKGHMKEVVDELIETGEAAKMVIIMPNAGGADIMNTWNGYLNMPGWNYEDFFFTELLPQAEAKYRCKSDKGHRAVMGLSMGGGGSVFYCQRHPEMFSSCYAMSAWMSFDGENKFPKDSKPYYVQESVRENSALRFVENADKETVNKLRSVKWFFDCGDDDFLFDLSVEMHKLMRQKRIKDELRIRNGVHNWEYWHQAIRMALPYATRNFDK